MQAVKGSARVSRVGEAVRLRELCRKRLFRRDTSTRDARAIRPRYSHARDFREAQAASLGSRYLAEITF